VSSCSTSLVSSLLFDSIAHTHSLYRPFWMSPRQVLIVPVTQTVYDYAEEVQEILSQKYNFYVDVDLTAETLNKKVRKGETSGYNFILIVGHDEKEKRAVNVRNGHGTQEKGRDEVVPIEEVCNRFVKLRDSRQIANEL
jgi:threonyl-tRNA synthetase